MPSPHDDYLARQPPAARRTLKQVRTLLRKALPGGEDLISYGIPAIRLHRRIAIYFAAWKTHWALYPISKRVERELGEALSRHELSHKGTIRFPYDAPVPARLITRIAKARAKELQEKR